MTEFGYRVVTGGDCEKLCSAVLTLAKDGWEPLGSISIAWVPHPADGHPLGWVQYAQAMIKRAPR